MQMEARKHFNCPALRGLELENAENSATNLHHWERRILHVRTYVDTSISTVEIPQNVHTTVIISLIVPNLIYPCPRSPDFVYMSIIQ